MKYWNKDKRIRQERWHKVARYVGANWNYTNVKRELQSHDSPGKFYMYYAGEYIWFELEEDAMWFLLKWK